jgi:hypothetical protein
LFDARHDAVLNAVKGVIKICKSKNVPVYISGTEATHSDFKSADAIFSEAKDFNTPTSNFSSNVGW